MSNVNHPAHYGGGDNPYEVIKVLRQWLTPTEFIGFCKGNSLKYTARANMKGGVEDHEKALWYDRQIVSFIHDQRAASKPDGLPVEPLYWADLYPCPCPDRAEVIACCENGCVAMLCSTVEPHVQWFVTLGGGDDDQITEFFSTSALAEQWLKEMLEEGRRLRVEALDRAWDLVGEGKFREAGELCDEFGYEFHRNLSTGIVKIHGATSREADGPEEAAQADDGA